MKSPFTAKEVQQVSKVLQDYMHKNNITSMTADECAQFLANNGIMPNNVGPQPGFNFRQMLRDGRDGLIPLVAGAYQERPRTRWEINRVSL